MCALPVGASGSTFLFVVVPGIALAVAIALSIYEVYHIGEQKLLVVIAILGLMLQHQVLEGYAFLQTGRTIGEGVGEIFETGANLIAASSVYYVLRFARRERRLVRSLERSERQYRDLVEESPVPIVIHGSAAIRYANDAAVEMLDADAPEELTGSGLNELLATDDPDEVCETVLTDGGTNIVETQLNTLEGRTRYATLTGAPADYEADNARQVVIQDQTERKRREREYEQIFHGVHDAIVVHDPATGAMVDVNDSTCELLGYDRETILDLGTGGISVSDEGFTEERAQEIIAQVVEEGERGPFEWKVETSDGDHRVLEVKATTAEIGGELRHVSINRDITKQKRRKREFEEIFNNVHDAISINDPETGEIRRVNDTMCELLGYDRETILELGVDGLSATDKGFDRACAKEFFETVSADGDTGQTEWAIETSDGEIRWLEVTATSAEIGGERRFITAYRDITERRRREQEYEQIFNSVTNAITVFHPETAEILDVNETYHELLGYDEFETIQELGIEGLSVTEEGYTGEKGRELVRGVAESGETRTVEWRGKRKDGTRLWLEATLTPATIGGERRVLSIQRDITERKRREREYEQIFNSVQDGIVVWDPESLDILDANDACLDMFGYDNREMFRDHGVGGFSVTEKGYTEQRWLNIHQGVVETGTPELVEWRGETRAGERIWLEIKVAPAIIGGEQRTISINRDVTERKRHEQRLEVFNRILRHNLRNQLDVIRSHAELLSHRTDGDHADTIIDSTDRLAAIGKRARKIDQFMSRECNEDSVDLSRTIETTLQSVRQSADDVEVTLNTPPESPLVTDSAVIETVLENALDNAVRYADSMVTVTVKPVDDGYAITIDDDGPGIPAGELSALESGSETPLQHGRGLGLWQLNWGVQKLKGSLSFDTEAGTTVHISIPNLETGRDES